MHDNQTQQLMSEKMNCWAVIHRTHQGSDHTHQHVSPHTSPLRTTSMTHWTSPAWRWTTQQWSTGLIKALITHTGTSHHTPHHYVLPTIHSNVVTMNCTKNDPLSQQHHAFQSYLAIRWNVVITEHGPYLLTAQTIHLTVSYISFREATTASAKSHATDG